MLRLALLFWLAAYAQEETAPVPPAPEAPAENRAEAEAAPQPPAPPPPPEVIDPITMSGARSNYPTLVENYILQHSKNEALPLKDKTGRNWKLRLEKIDLETLRELKRGFYAACVRMRDGADRVDLDVTVDFSTARWKVHSVNVHKVNGKARFKYKGSERVPL
ncbi:MAG: hypothetical protein HY925_06715 [Elusimicrobia bacterium]|nr:hypothetical protein [Elusimicrobiota bacterium]